MNHYTQLAVGQCEAGVLAKYSKRHAAFYVALASLLLAGCGGSDSDTTSATATAVATVAYERVRNKVAVSGSTVLANAESTGTLRVFKAIPFAPHRTPGMQGA